MDFWLVIPHFWLCYNLHSKIPNGPTRVISHSKLTLSNLWWIIVKGIVIIVPLNHCAVHCCLRRENCCMLLRRKKREWHWIPLNDIYLFLYLFAVNMSKNIHTVTAKYKDPNKIESSAIWTRVSQVTNSTDFLLIVVFNYLCTTILGNV